MEISENKKGNIVITGATSGIGLAAAKTFASSGYCVIGVGRTEDNCAAARESVLKANPAAGIIFFCADLSNQSEVNRVSKSILGYVSDRGEGIDALINNVGGVRSVYTETPDGIETQFALNHIAGFLLTYRLLTPLKKSGGSIIMTGSESHKHMRINWKDIMFKDNYSCLFAYKQSKLCNLLFAAELNRRFRDKGIRAYVVDPGLVNTDIGSKQTNSAVNLFWRARRRFGNAPEVPAMTFVYLCAEKPEGLYFRSRENKRYNSIADDENEALKLFKLSEQLCGIRYE